MYCVCVSVCVSVCVCAHAFVLPVYVCVFVPVCVCAYMCVYAGVYMCACEYMSLCVCFEDRIQPPEWQETLHDNTTTGLELKPPENINE